MYDVPNNQHLYVQNVIIITFMNRLNKTGIASQKGLEFQCASCYNQSRGVRILLIYCENGNLINFSHMNRICFCTTNVLSIKNPQNCPLPFLGPTQLTTPMAPLITSHILYTATTKIFYRLQWAAHIDTQNCPFSWDDQNCHQHCTFFDPHDPLP